MQRSEVRVALIGQRPRGHLQDLLANPPVGICYLRSARLVPTDVVAGRPAMSHASLMSRIARSPIVVRAGIFLPVLLAPRDAEMALCVNRFYAGGKPAVIWLERPAAPLHYEPMRLRSRLTRWAVRALLQARGRLHVCWSEVCREEFRALYSFAGEVETATIPPLVVPPAAYRSEERVERRQRTPRVSFLFVGSRFHAKGGKELVLAFREVAREEQVGNLTIVTDPESVGAAWLYEIGRCPKVRLIPATLDRTTMWKLLDSHQVLVHPTLYDSFPLVVLEALRMGLPVLATSVYAIPEILAFGGGVLLSSYSVSWDGIGYSIERAERMEVVGSLVDELVARMRSVLDEGSRVEMAKVGLAVGETRFGTKSLNDKWIQVYNRLLADQ